MGKPLKPAWRETPILYGEGRSQIHEENGESSEMEQGRERRFSKMV